MRRYYLDENNSGGSWWLDEKQYKELFTSGWKLKEGWDADAPGPFGIDRKKPWLDRGDSGVPYGWRHDNVYLEANSIKEAVDSFELATGESFFAQGCNCCGVPFSLSTNYDEDKAAGLEHESISGDDADVYVRAPW